MRRGERNPSGRRGQTSGGAPDHFVEEKELVGNVGVGAVGVAPTSK